MVSISADLENAVGDVEIPFGPGFYDLADRDYLASPLVTTRTPTTGPFAGWRILKSTVRHQAVLRIDAPHGLKFLSNTGARLMFDGWSIANGEVVVSQPDVAFWDCDMSFPAAVWSGQGASYKSASVQTTAGSNVIRGAAGLFSGMAGKYVTFAAAGIGGPNVISPVLNNISADGSSAQLSFGTATSTRTGVAYMGGVPETGYYQKNRALAIDSLQAQRTYILGCDIHGASVLLDKNGARDLSMEGTMLYDVQQPPHDPSNVITPHGYRDVGVKGSANSKVHHNYIEYDTVFEDRDPLDVDVAPNMNQAAPPGTQWDLVYYDEFDDGVGSSGPNNGINRVNHNSGWLAGAPTTPSTLGVVNQLKQPVQPANMIEYDDPASVIFPGDGTALFRLQSGPPFTGPDGVTRTVRTGELTTAGGLCALNPLNVPLGSLTPRLNVTGPLCVEWKAKLPGPNAQASRYWPVFWTTNAGNYDNGANWPGGTGWKAEIDAFEWPNGGSLGQNCGFYLHAASEYSVSQACPAALLGTDLSLAYHTFTMWTDGLRIKTWIDGQLCANVNPSQAAVQAQWQYPHYLLMAFQARPGAVLTSTPTLKTRMNGGGGNFAISSQQAIDAGILASTYGCIQRTGTTFNSTNPNGVGLQNLVDYKNAGVKKLCIITDGWLGGFPPSGDALTWKGYWKTLITRIRNAVGTGVEVWLEFVNEPNFANALNTIAGARLYFLYLRILCDARDEADPTMKVMTGGPIYLPTNPQMSGGWPYNFHNATGSPSAHRCVGPVDWYLFGDDAAQVGAANVLSKSGVDALGIHAYPTGESNRRRPSPPGNATAYVHYNGIREISFLIDIFEARNWTLARNGNVTPNGPGLRFSCTEQGVGTAPSFDPANPFTAAGQVRFPDQGTPHTPNFSNPSDQCILWNTPQAYRARSDTSSKPGTNDGTWEPVSNGTNNGVWNAGENYGTENGVGWNLYNSLLVCAGLVDDPDTLATGRRIGPYILHYMCFRMIDSYGATSASRGFDNNSAYTYGMYGRDDKKKGQPKSTDPSAMLGRAGPHEAFKIIGAMPDPLASTSASDMGLQYMRVWKASAVAAGPGAVIQGIDFDDNWIGSTQLVPQKFHSLALPTNQGVLGSQKNSTIWSTALGAATTTLREDVVRNNSSGAISTDGTAPWNTLDPTRVNVVESNVTRRTSAPTGLDPKTVPANPANVWRSTWLTRRNEYMGWTSIAPPPVTGDFDSIGRITIA